MKQKSFLAILTALLLFCNVSMHQNSIGTLLADYKTDIIVSITTSLISSVFSGSSSSGDYVFLSDPEAYGTRECGTEEVMYFRTMSVLQVDGTYKNERVYQDSDYYVCQKLVREATIKTQDETRKLRISREGKEEIKCKSFGLTLSCNPRSLSCEEQEFDCSLHF